MVRRAVGSCRTRASHLAPVIFLRSPEREPCFLSGGLLLAIVIEERISTPLKSLTMDLANALGRGESVSFAGASPVTEINALAQDLERAASLLRERARERDRAEAEIRQINQEPRASGG